MRQSGKNVSPMSNEGRNAYVISHITDAMLSLLEEKPMEEISISELVDRAQVGRASSLVGHGAYAPMPLFKTVRALLTHTAFHSIFSYLPIKQTNPNARFK